MKHHQPPPAFTSPSRLLASRLGASSHCLAVQKTPKRGVSDALLAFRITVSQPRTPPAALRAVVLCMAVEIAQRSILQCSNSFSHHSAFQALHNRLKDNSHPYQQYKPIKPTSPHSTPSISLTLKCRCQAWATLRAVIPRHRVCTAPAERPRPLSAHRQTRYHAMAQMTKRTG
jgi:hypothetical protein